MSQIIPQNIDYEETLVRCIFHSLFCSIYETPVQKGKPAPRHRATAQLLCNKANFYIDKEAESEEWIGPKLMWSDE